MATLITPATATITYNLIITGFADEVGDYGITHSTTIASITESYKRVIPVPSGAETEILGISGTTGKGIMQDVDTVIITNLDDTNFVRIRVSENGGDTVDFRLDAGQTMVWNNTDIEVNVTEAAFGAFVTADMISAQADTADVDVEFIVINT